MTLRMTNEGEAGVGHTPGPWGVNCSHIYAPDGEIIATVRNPGSKASDYPLVANRNLMAAAPAMLDALEGLLATHKQGRGQCCEAADKAIDAIALARSGDALAKGEGK